MKTFQTWLNEKKSEPIVTTTISSPIRSGGSGAAGGNPGSSEDESGHGVKHDTADYTISDETYPMTYVKLHKDPKDSSKVSHAEFHHTSIDFKGERPTTPERVGTLVKSSDTHKKLKSQGYDIERYGEHKPAPKSYYTHPVKVTKEEVELTELIAGVGPVKQTTTPQSRVTSHTGGVNAPVQAKYMQRAAQARVQQKEKFAHAQKDYAKQERETLQRQRESDRKKRETETKRQIKQRPVGGTATEVGKRGS
jgi:hypothetical protein